MSIWEILNIEPTENLREIKRAYARCLKEKRPDEDPDGFEQLYTAYKQALIASKEGRISSLDNGTCENDRFTEAESVNSSVAEPPEEVKHAFEKLMASLESLLVGETDQNDPANWRIIENEPKLLDDEFNHHVSFALFALILAHNQTFSNMPELRMRSPQVIRYLDSYVDWANKEQILCDIHGSEVCEPYFKSLHLGTGDQSKANNARGGEAANQADVKAINKWGYYFLATVGERYGAGFCDLVIVMSPVAVYYIFFPMGKGGPEYVWAYAIFVYLLIINMMECSPLQASPGKLMMGQKVYNRDLGRISIWQGLLRLIVHAGLLMGYIFSMILLSITRGKFPQDVISKTMVVNVEKTLELYKKDKEIEL